MSISQLPQLAMFILVVAAPMAAVAQDLSVSRAELDKGLAVVRGKAAPGAVLTWDARIIAVATDRGRFTFKAPIPGDCAGTLSDGDARLEVAITGCIQRTLRTGQTKCFLLAVGPPDIPCPDTGQDGERQNGAARSYTVHGDGTVTDEHSGLRWEVLTNSGDGSIHDVANVYDWPGAFQKIADLNAAQFAGFNDWRLPNVTELHALVDYGRNQPAIDPVFSNGTDSFTAYPDDYWSSTTIEAGAWAASGAMAVNFSGLSHTVYPVEKWRSAPVRAVRGGP